MRGRNGKIIYARAFKYEHQYNLLLGLAAKMAEEPFRLLIAKSVLQIPYTAYTRLDLKFFLFKSLCIVCLSCHEHIVICNKNGTDAFPLIKIAEEFNVAVYMTNQVITSFDQSVSFFFGGGVFISDPKKPAGGHVLAHATTTRLMLSKGKGPSMLFFLTARNVFQITAGGIADAKDGSAKAFL
ncbi:hypothetical protein M0R45_030032 [Rubus argutus]|uniref:RecA family profile 2 domain-containing protein n=1 Tax=Rubus argutus TaxID=59490 RepID=A0AAW1WDQ0_RUBAR